LKWYYQRLKNIEESWRKILPRYKKSDGGTRHRNKNRIEKIEDALL
jgi:hypothetical protein